MQSPFAAALFGAALLLVGAPLAAKAAGETEELLKHSWSFDGVFGRFDREAAQRGLQVTQQVCASCHGLQYVAFRTLTELGYTEDEVRDFAAQFFVDDIDPETGAVEQRPAIPSDRWPNPWANPVEAALIHGKVPPDLSLMAKAREGGPTYVYSLLQGYDDEQTAELDPGNYWNRFYPGHIIAMAQPLYDGMVVYEDGTEATLEQMASDVGQFLMWTAEPKLENRKRIGLGFMLFCTVMAGVFYAMKRRIWSDVH